MLGSENQPPVISQMSACLIQEEEAVSWERGAHGEGTSRNQKPEEDPADTSSSLENVVWLFQSIDTSLFM